MDRFESYSRLTGDDRFRWIADGSLDSFDRLQPKILKLRKEMSEVLSDCADPDNPPTDYYTLRNDLHTLEEKRDQACIIAVVFTAMYFEAFIYDYSASCLGDRYSKDHLDKLDFISKWLVIPKLVTGKEISKSSQAYESLKRLHMDRNLLVHLKSRALTLDHDAIAKYLIDREKGIEQSVTNCCFALKCVIAELTEMDPDHPKLRLASQSRNKSIQPTAKASAD